jgi:hypothetical protein
LSGNSSEPEASAVINIHYEDADTARFIVEAISPDNLQAQKGVTVEAKANECTMHLKVTCSRGVGSLIATVDDLLSCVQAAERAISEIIN